MTFVQKWIYRKQGGHYWVAVFSGPDWDHLAKCGDLCFRENEFPHLIEQVSVLPRFIIVESKVV